MDDLMVIVLAISAACFMANLARGGASPSLKAAIRTTLVIILAWSLAYAKFGRATWSSLQWQTHWILVLSVFAILLAWTLHIAVRQFRPNSPIAVMDYANIVFALLIAVLWSSESNSAPPLSMVCMIIGVLILAFGRR